MTPERVCATFCTALRAHLLKEEPNEVDEGVIVTLTTSRHVFDFIPTRLVVEPEYIDNFEFLELHAGVEPPVFSGGPVELRVIKECTLRAVFVREGTDVSIRLRAKKRSAFLGYLMGVQR